MLSSQPTIVVSASLIAQRVISFNRQSFYLRLGVGLEVVATPTIPEVHYNRRRTREVQSQIRDEPSTIAKCEDSHSKDLSACASVSAHLSLLELLVCVCGGVERAKRATP